MSVVILYLRIDKRVIILTTIWLYLLETRVIVLFFDNRRKKVNIPDL